MGDGGGDGDGGGGHAGEFGGFSSADMGAFSDSGPIGGPAGGPGTGPASGDDTGGSSLGSGEVSGAVGPASDTEISDTPSFANSSTMAEYLGMTNMEMNIAALNALSYGMLGPLAPDIFGQAEAQLAQGMDLGEPIGDDDEGYFGTYAEGGGYRGDLEPYPWMTGEGPTTGVSGVNVDSALSAAEEERRRIARLTGRRSTMLTQGLSWEPNTKRTTLLGR